MKFTSKILTFLAFSTAYSLTIPNNNIYKRADFDISTLTIFKECDAAIEKECSLSNEINKENIESTCATYNSDKCKKLMADGVSSIPACSSLGKELSGLKDELIKLQKTTFGILCTKDEKGNLCPFAEYELNNPNFINFNIKETDDTKTKTEEEKAKEEEATVSAINETCKSKICTDTLVEGYSTLTKYEKELESKLNIKMKREFKLDKSLNDEQNLQKLFEYLKSEECTAQATESNQTESNQTSNASTMKFRSAIIVSLSLLLYVLFK